MNFQRSIVSRTFGTIAFQVSSKSAQLKANFLEEEEEEYRPSEKEVDSTYSDPLGPAPERPRTSAGNRGRDDNDFDDDVIGDDLLPE